MKIGVSLAYYIIIYMLPSILRTLKITKRFQYVWLRIDTLTSTYLTTCKN